jgi:nucleotide-binding universal stress UspA family protein
MWWHTMSDVLRRRLSIPIHLVKGYSSPVDLTADPIARHILVPLDGSILSASILKHVASFARLEGATLTLLNVQNEDWTRGFFDHSNPRDYLLSATRSLKSIVSSVDAHVITTDRSPAQAIATFAEQSNVDLIALATRADAGLSRLMRGSIADTLIRQTNLPVLVRKFDGRPFRPESSAIA